jgi:hypothetical protein
MGKLSRNKAQEIESRGQFAARIAKQNWAPDDITNDTGEDLIVRIFEDELPTGMSFYVQLKSDEDTDSIKLESGELSYPVDVKDLKDWEISIMLVFLVIWDMKKQFGFWVEIGDAIKQLDKTSPNWRTQKTANVHIPRGNDTSDAGLNGIRHRVAVHSAPIAINKEVKEIKLLVAFPETPEGQKKKDEFQRLIDAGEPIRLEKEHIKELEGLPLKRLFGDTLQLGELHLGTSPSVTEQHEPARIDIFSNNNEIVSIPFVDLKIENKGKKETTLSNTHQSIPAKFRITFIPEEEKTHVTLGIFLDGLGLSAIEMRESLKLQRCIAMGGRLRILRRQNAAQMDFPVPKNFAGMKEPSESLLQFIDDLCCIEIKTGVAFCFPPDWNVDMREREELERLVKAIKKGKVIYQNLLDAPLSEIEKFRVNEALKNNEKDKILDEIKDFNIVVFNKTINLGKRIRKLIFIPVTTNESDEHSRDAEEKALAETTLVRAAIVDEFPDWVVGS